MASGAQSASGLRGRELAGIDLKADHSISVEAAEKAHASSLRKTQAVFFALFLVATAVWSCHLGGVDVISESLFYAAIALSTLSAILLGALEIMIRRALASASREGETLDEEVTVERLRTTARGKKISLASPEVISKVSAVAKSDPVAILEEADPDANEELTSTLIEELVTPKREADEEDGAEAPARDERKAAEPIDPSTLGRRARTALARHPRSAYNTLGRTATAAVFAKLSPDDKRVFLEKLDLSDQVKLLTKWLKGLGSAQSRSVYDFFETIPFDSFVDRMKEHPKLLAALARHPKEMIQLLGFNPEGSEGQESARSAIQLIAEQDLFTFLDPIEANHEVDLISVLLAGRLSSGAALQPEERAIAQRHPKALGKLAEGDRASQQAAAALFLEPEGDRMSALVQQLPEGIQRERSSPVYSNH